MQYTDYALLSTCDCLLHLEYTLPLVLYMYFVHRHTVYGVNLWMLLLFSWIHNREYFLDIDNFLFAFVFYPIKSLNHVRRCAWSHIVQKRIYTNQIVWLQDFHAIPLQKNLVNVWNHGNLRNQVICLQSCTEPT